ncbi:MAG: peptide chain release factor N(5)-glutamine methyltransferase, partial [Gemmatimonadetes bacterium]|nr:peptide chain release factor N(5)-glutamine methyltransferase [Gemmatimonadota bacterium]
PPPGGARERRWTVMEVARWSGDFLRGRGVEDGRLNAEYLLAHVLGIDRLQLYLDFDRPLAETELAVYRPLLRRRAAREPLQYLLGSAPFRDLELAVDPRVAIPRPETEYLLEVLARIAGRHRVFESALDVGTGSGAIAIALASEGLARSVTATDISADALEVARLNARACGRPAIGFRLGSLLDPVGGLTFDLVLSNPPYLSEAEWRGAEPEVREWEPRAAMVAGQGGLALIAALVAGVAAVLRPDGWFGLEVGSAQGETVAGLISDAGRFRSIQLHDDLTGRQRYVFARRLTHDQH